MVYLLCTAALAGVNSASHCGLTESRLMVRCSANDGISFLQSIYVSTMINALHLRVLVDS